MIRILPWLSLVFTSVLTCCRRVRTSLWWPCDLKSIFGIIALCDALDDVQLGIFSESLPSGFVSGDQKKCNYMIPSIPHFNTLTSNLICSGHQCCPTLRSSGVHLSHKVWKYQIYCRKTDLYVCLKMEFLSHKVWKCRIYFKITDLYVWKWNFFSKWKWTFFQDLIEI